MHVVPLHVVVGGTEHAEGVDIDAAAVAAALRSFTPVSTSRPAPAAFLEAYRAAAAAGADAVVSVHISGDMSSTIGGADDRGRRTRRCPSPSSTRGRSAWPWGMPCSPVRGWPPVARRRGRWRMPCARRARHPRSCSTSTPSSTCAAAAGSARPVRCWGRRCRSSRSSGCATGTSCRWSGCARRPGPSPGSRTSRSRRPPRCRRTPSGSTSRCTTSTRPSGPSGSPSGCAARLGDEVAVRVVELGPSWGRTSGRARWRSPWCPVVPCGRVLAR